jgi:hypothetical protein
MELGKTLNLDGHAAYQPEHTYAHPIANSFASAIGFDAEGKNVSPDGGPMGASVHSPSGAPDFRSGAR